MPQVRVEMSRSFLCPFCMGIVMGDVGMTPEYVEARVKAQTRARSRVLIREDGISVVVALGPLAVGNLLVIPDEHEFSFAQLDRSRADIVSRMVHRVALRMQSWADDVMVFEHGAISNCNVDAPCMDHVHIQVIPVPRGVLPVVQAELGEGERLRDLAGLNDSGFEEDYLFVESMSSEDARLFRSSPKLTSQFMRKVLGPILEPARDWNWRNDARLDLIDLTLEKWQS